MPYAMNGAVRIHYQCLGQGPALVLQHWSVSDLGAWGEHGYLDGLKDHVRLVLVDARGHGGSDKPEEAEAYALEHRVQDLVAVLDALGIDRAHFFGYSMGGWIGFGAGKLAAERFRSLIIGGQHAYAQDLGSMRRLAQVGLRQGPEAFVAWWEKHVGPCSEARRQAMLGYDFGAFLRAAQDRDSLEPALAGFRLPCLLLCGDRDEAYAEARRSAAAIPGASFLTLPGLDHGQTIARSDLVIPAILDFIQTVDAHG